MKTYKKLYEKLISFENLESAYEKAKKQKLGNPKVLEFEKHWRFHLCNLMRELLTKTYIPQPLKKFVLRDPKTRIICVSNFRDRVVHHALVNVLQPIFEPQFIHDSFASQKGKGTLPALERFQDFLRKISRNGKLVTNAKNNNQIIGFALKCDIKHYFETIDHQVLLRIIIKTISDKNIIWLIKQILENYDSGVPSKGMPLGNWTSQFFANIYLNALDQYVKHKLKAKYYIRYVDDFVILHKSKFVLKYYKNKINEFLTKLCIELHPNKCKILPLGQGVSFLGFRVFYHYKIVRRRNLRKIKAKLISLLEDYENENIELYEILEVLQGWNAYAMNGNTYKLRQKLEQEIKKELERITKNRLPPPLKLN